MTTRIIRPAEDVGPTLTLDADARDPASARVRVHNLHPEQIASMQGWALPASRLPHILRVSVAEPGPGADGELPDILGCYQVAEDGIQFIPLFPFEPGVRYRASFDPGTFGLSEQAEVATLEFQLPNQMNTKPSQVEHIFPSVDVLPENLLRFYVSFSNPMQRGQAAKQINILDPDGRPAPDVLYRPPVELWDKRMMQLTVLLDPGRLKRWVGPHRELGPPLRAGQTYTLVVCSGMVDESGHPLSRNFEKPFGVAAAIREPVAVADWEILPPAANGRQALTIEFPRPLDWAMLWHAITIATEDGEPIDGQNAIDQGERRWRFIPASPWVVGSYAIRVASNLEDVCGNNLLGAFDRSLRSAGDLAREEKSHLIFFRVER
jgi:hypothetical protein